MQIKAPTHIAPMENIEWKLGYRAISSEIDPSPKRLSINNRHPPIQ